MHSSYCDIYIPYEIKDELYIKRVYFTPPIPDEPKLEVESPGNIPNSIYFWIIQLESILSMHRL